MRVRVRTSGQLSPALKQLRKQRGWSQAELGKHLGLSQERVSAIENHPERVTVDQLLTVLMVLDGELQVRTRVPDPDLATSPDRRPPAPPAPPTTTTTRRRKSPAQW